MHACLDKYKIQGVYVHIQKQLVKLGSSRPPIAYDALSLDTGITPSAQGVPGALDHATPVKPVSRCSSHPIYSYFLIQSMHFQITNCLLQRLALSLFFRKSHF